MTTRDENPSRPPVAAVSISGPKRRIGEESVDEPLFEALRDTANVIELDHKHY